MFSLKMTLTRLCKATLFLHLLVLIILVCNNINYLNPKPLGFSLKLVPRDSPDSPYRPRKLSDRQRIRRVAEFSERRAYNHLSSSPSSTQKTTNIVSPTSDTNNFHLQILKRDFFYTAQVFIGTPKTPQTLLIDTGSGLIWTQCRPCKNCFSQKRNIPIFTPNGSASYKKLPCNHQLCGQLYHQCVDGQCVYSQRYSGGSVTNGVVSLETFSFPSNHGGFKAIENVVFGCSNDNKNFMFTSISGILGLSYSPDSLVTQLGNSINKRFSYCLPYSHSPMTVNSVLRFGNDIKKSPLAKRTSFVRGLIGNRTSPTTPTLHHYYLNLLDISVARRRLGFPPGTFALGRDGGEGGGCVIDSGSVSSFLDEKAYDVVMAEFDTYFRRLGLQRARNLTVGFEFCYRPEIEIDERFKGYADLTFHFDGADFVVEPKYVYFYNVREKYFCVALLPFPGKTIIGAWQQQNTRFVYDLDLHELQFAPEDCSRDRIS